MLATQINIVSVLKIKLIIYMLVGIGIAHDTNSLLDSENDWCLCFEYTHFNIMFNLKEFLHFLEPNTEASHISNCPCWY